MACFFAAIVESKTITDSRISFVFDRGAIYRNPLGDLWPAHLVFCAGIIIARINADISTLNVQPGGGHPPVPDHLNRRAASSELEVTECILLVTSDHSDRAANESNVAHET